MLELWPLSRNATIAPNVATIVAVAYVWAGERDASLQLLAQFEQAVVVLLPLGFDFYRFAVPFAFGRGSAENGREPFSGVWFHFSVRIFIKMKPRTVPREMGASAPPVSTASRRRDSICRTE